MRLVLIVTVSYYSYCVNTPIFIVGAIRKLTAPKILLVETVPKRHELLLSEGSQDLTVSIWLPASVLWKICEVLTKC